MKDTHKKTATCPTCQKEFSYYSSGYRDGIKRYCSRACQSKDARIFANCPKCGKEFWYHRSWPRKFCSHKCSTSANAIINLGEFVKGEAPKLVSCEVCGKQFSKLSCQVKATKHNFCSLKCFGVFVSQNKTGENASNWRGGYLPYYGGNWRQQRRNARYRDGYKCRKCGATEVQLGKALDVHHIVPFRVFGVERYKEANTLSNLISLCNVCHTLIEKETPYAW